MGGGAGGGSTSGGGAGGASTNMGGSGGIQASGGQGDTGDEEHDGQNGQDDQDDQDGSDSEDNGEVASENKASGCSLALRPLPSGAPLVGIGLLALLATRRTRR